MDNVLDVTPSFAKSGKINASSEQQKVRVTVSEKFLVFIIIFGLVFFFNFLFSLKHYIVFGLHCDA
jgi:hypothetical protein